KVIPTDAMGLSDDCQRVVLLYAANTKQLFNIWSALIPAPGLQNFTQLKTAELSCRKESLSRLIRVTGNIDIFPFYPHFRRKLIFPVHLERVIFQHRLFIYFFFQSLFCPLQYTAQSQQLFSLI